MDVAKARTVSREKKPFSLAKAYFWKRRWPFFPKFANSTLYFINALKMSFIDMELGKLLKAEDR